MGVGSECMCGSGCMCGMWVWVCIGGCVGGWVGCVGVSGWMGGMCWWVHAWMDGWDVSVGV